MKKLTRQQKEILESMVACAKKNTKDGNVDITIDVTQREAGVLRRALKKVATEGTYNGLSFEFGQGSTESQYSGYRLKSESNAPVVYITGIYKTVEQKLSEAL